MSDKGHRQYEVKLAGSRRMTIRNRRHLKKMVENIPGIIPNMSNSHEAHKETVTTGMPQATNQHQPTSPTETLMPPAQ